jgi:fused signal recognition particle receptor
MFGLLKNKLTSFISSLTGREEKKAPKDEIPAQAPSKEEIPKEMPKMAEKMPAEVPKPELQIAKKAEPREEKKEVPKIKDAHPKALAPEPAKAEKKAPPERRAAQETAEQAPSKQIPSEPAKHSNVETGKHEHAKSVSQVVAPKHVESAKPTMQAPPVEQKKPQMGMPQSPAFPTQQKSISDNELSRLERKAQSQKKEMAPKIGLGSAIKSFFSNDVTIGEAEVSDLLEELELSLLEADVAYEVSLEVSSQLRSRLIGMKVPKNEISKRTKETISSVLESVMTSERDFNFIERIRSLPKPAKILFVGPNGAGKTTTMAKVARMLMDSGLSVVFSASDTFRAAAIEQTEVHAGRLGVRVVKSNYGADPASVAFDAINLARSSGIDVVLIDSAGRQDTNVNLLDELKKMDRVAKPDLKIYIGESIGGNSIIEQIKAFDGAIGIDGAILTKLDCDAKGGTAISVAKAAGIPVLFLGIGQGYGDLEPFDAHKIAQEIMN